MKTLNRFALLATVVVAFSSLSTAALAGTATGTANATVLVPMVVTAGTALNFGAFSPGASGGVVTMTPGGSRSTTGPTLQTSVGGNAGTFTLAGSGNLTYAITVPSSLTVNGPTSSTMVGTITVTSGTGTLAAGIGSFPVGGTLTVASNQTAGAYTGTYTMTVDYN